MSDISSKSISEFSVEDWNAIGAGAYERAKRQAFSAGLPIATEIDGITVLLFEDGHTEPYSSVLKAAE